MDHQYSGNNFFGCQPFLKYNAEKNMQKYISIRTTFAYTAKYSNIMVRLIRLEYLAVADNWNLYSNIMVRLIRLSCFFPNVELQTFIYLLCKCYQDIIEWISNIFRYVSNICHTYRNIFDIHCSIVLVTHDLINEHNGECRYHLLGQTTLKNT